MNFYTCACPLNTSYNEDKKKQTKKLPGLFRKLLFSDGTGQITEAVVVLQSYFVKKRSKMKNRCVAPDQTVAVCAIVKNTTLKTCV